MPYGSGTYAEYAARMNDWMKYKATGANITNRTLDLANRSQNWLIMYRPWADLKKTAELTVSDNEADFPSDFARMVHCNWDSDGDGKPDGYFFDRGRIGQGYLVTDIFDKDTGHARVIKFFNTLSQTPKMVYIHYLDDFEGTGDEYSFFPGELLLRTAQMLHSEETGLKASDISPILSSHKRLLDMYTAAHTYDAELSRVINDSNGNEIIMDDINLAGGCYSSRNHNMGLSRDTDMRW